MNTFVDILAWLIIIFTMLVFVCGFVVVCVIGWAITSDKRMAKVMGLVGRINDRIDKFGW
jgi:uncharacterized membrane protein